MATDTVAEEEQSIAIEMWAHDVGAWRPVTNKARRLPNTGSFQWVTPSVIQTPLLLRVRAIGELGVEHVVQMSVE